MTAKGRPCQGNPHATDWAADLYLERYQGCVTPSKASDAGGSRPIPEGDQICTIDNGQLTAARATAAWILLKPVVDCGDRDLEITRRFRTAAAIVQHWPGLSHEARIALARSLPWETAVQLAGGDWA